ncbi:NBR1-Ig-like domain-containing protein [Nonomuraea turcica]|uniref:NBR1-Ig-like domain-containing protein n=1 Tax=Nonomuraea sp. G32 TaxID=3067274 RepID=UPI00273A9AA2|nr:NBR1-Ig-like domain-containing protein [Nonomuraea sp. G32]MDP4506835.1 NBR1-Ig-like domain-containing protein [Nonomuraea sp. G32]
MVQSSGPQDEAAASRRGRKPIRPDPASGPVALFAHRLWELKEQAGDPSFADMASRLGAAASKSSLAAAARGSALPTWETTWEFVRVLAVDRLGRDAEEARREWRAHWELAASTAQTETAPPPEAASRPETAPHADVRSDAASHAADLETVAEATETEVLMAENPVARARSTPSKSLIAAIVTGATGLAAALFAWLAPGPEPAEPAARSTPAPSNSSFDDSLFEGDVTHPDGTVVKKGTEFTKIWRIRNAGTIPWQDRYLTRLNDTPCKAPKRVAIRPVQPGQSVEIAVRVRAADSPGRCKIYWKMTDAAGAELLTAKKPIFLDVVVA